MILLFLQIVLVLLGLCGALFTLRGLSNERDLHRGTNICFQVLTLLHSFYLTTDLFYYYHSTIASHQVANEEDIVIWRSAFVFFIQKLSQLSLLWVTIILGAYRFLVTSPPTTFVYKRSIFIIIVMVVITTCPKILAVKIISRQTNSTSVSDWSELTHESSICKSGVMGAQCTTHYQLDSSTVFDNPLTDWLYHKLYSILVENVLPVALLSVILYRITMWCLDHRAPQNVYYIKQFDQSFFEAWFYDNSEYTVALMIIISLICNGLRFVVDLWLNMHASHHQGMGTIQVGLLSVCIHHSRFINSMVMF